MRVLHDAQDGHRDRRRPNRRREARTNLKAEVEVGGPVKIVVMSAPRIRRLG